MGAVRMLRDRDPGGAAMRRSCRAGIVAPGLFALSVELIGNATTGLFAAFGSIALLLFVDFRGPLRQRLALQATLVLAGVFLICVGTLASRSAWLAAVATAVVAFCVVFSGVVSSTVASCSTSLLATFILAVTLPGSPGTIPERLAGHLMAGAASFIAVAVLWPAPVREPLRLETARTCTLLARRLRAEAECVRGDAAAHCIDEARAAADEATDAVAMLRRSFFATPYRPTGLASGERALIRLVDEVLGLEEILGRTPLGGSPLPTAGAVREARLAAADLLEAGARALAADTLAPGTLQAGRQRILDTIGAVEHTVTVTPWSPDGLMPQTPTPDLVSSLEPGFRSQEISSTVSAIVTNITVVLAAHRLRWWERALGRRPAGLPSSLSSAQERAAAHATLRSVWLRNSFRAAIALGLAVLIAEISGVQHSFWVVFGAMAVLRSNAVQTGQNALRAILGTAAGIVVGGALIYTMGSDTTVFWILLPFAVVFTGLAPAAVSFAAGQAGFTAALLILFNIIAPVGWSIGLVRIEDVAIGCAVSIGAGLLFWPRGAGAALGRAMADSFAESARYLRRSVEYGVSRCDASAVVVPAPEDERRNAAAAGRRLDDAFRGFLAERGTKRLPLAEATKVVTAVAVLRLTADAILSLWEQDEGTAADDHTGARAELLEAGSLMCAWYHESARALAGDGDVPDPTEWDPGAADRLLAAVRHDVAGRNPGDSRTAVKVLWTADHIDVARRLQGSIVEPLRAVVALQEDRSWSAGAAERVAKRIREIELDAIRDVRERA